MVVSHYMPTFDVLDRVFAIVKVSISLEPSLWMCYDSAIAGGFTLIT